MDDFALQVAIENTRGTMAKTTNLASFNGRKSADFSLEH